VDSPVPITLTEERGAIDRVEDPDPIGLTKLTKFLAEERIFGPCFGQRLPKQSLDCLVGLGDRCAVGLQRCRNVRIEVSEREFRRQIRRVERELEVTNTVHHKPTLPTKPRPRSAALGRSGSAAGDEGDHDVGGMAVEVLAPPVVDGRGSGVGVTGGDLDVSQRDAGVEGGHDERGSQHVGMHAAESGTLPDRANPPVSRAPVEALAVTAQQDRTLVALTDGQVDRPGGSGYERHGGGFVALAHDPQRAMAALETEVLDVGGTGLAH